MRDIKVSVEVFARIWGLREAGEGDEDQILRRVLQVDEPREEASEPSDDRDDHEIFPQGFRIFRNYKGRIHEAVRKSSGWVLLDDNKLYPSINQMSVGIGIRNENVWTNWEYRNDQGDTRKIAELRSEDQVRRRKAIVPLNLEGIEL